MLLTFDKKESVDPLPAELRTATEADWDWDTARDDFIRYAQRRALGPSTASLVRSRRSSEARTRSACVAARRSSRSGRA